MQWGEKSLTNWLRERWTAEGRREGREGGVGYGLVEGGARGEPQRPVACGLLVARKEGEREGGGQGPLFQLW